jgi:hypothetical protein
MGGAKNMGFLVGTVSNLGSVGGRTVFSAKDALAHAAELRAFGNNAQITFTDAATGDLVSEARVKRVAAEDAQRSPEEP